MIAFAVAIALLAPPVVTYDTLPVFVSPPGRDSISVDFAWGGGLGSRPPIHLGVFRRPQTIADAAPFELQRFAQFTGGRLQRSRLLVTAGATRIYAFPADGGKVCVMKIPLGGGTCLASLIDGAYPQVDPRRDVWGIVDDGATKVDVRVAGKVLHPRVGRNAFFMDLPAGAVAPTRIIVRERDGTRHIYDVRRCNAGNISPLSAPLAPPC